MMRYFLASITVLFVFNISVAEEKINPGFDCSKAMVGVEEVICSNKELSYLDRQLSVYYQKAFLTLPGDKKNILKKEQQDWLNERNKSCTAAIESSSSNKDSNKFLACLFNLYRTRNFQLFKQAYGNNEKSIVNVIGSLDFVDFLVSGPLTPSQITQLEKVRIDHGYFPNGLKPDFSEAAIYTCKDYQKDSVNVQSRFNMSLVGNYFIPVCETLTVLSKAKLAKTNYLKGDDLLVPKFFSLSILKIFAEDEKEINTFINKKITMPELIQQNKVYFEQEKNGAFSLKFYAGSPGETSSYDYGLYKPLAIADFIGNGYASLLVNVVSSISDGSYEASYNCLMTRNSKDGVLMLEKCSGSAY